MMAGQFEQVTTRDSSKVGDQVRELLTAEQSPGPQVLAVTCAGQYVTEFAEEVRVNLSRRFHLTNTEILDVDTSDYQAGGGFTSILQEAIIQHSALILLVAEKARIKEVAQQAADIGQGLDTPCIVIVIGPDW